MFGNKADNIVQYAESNQFRNEQRSEKMRNNYLFGLWGLTVHCFFLWGVLDANFHSPIIQGLPTIPPLKDPPAKRLVLFVADGLRFRTFMESPPPYLRNIMNNEGMWGVSHTRVPTESRPGNIAIAAGLYEDPSAIFKGWKENPVDFDSVFNQSYTTWAWGSPDIIPMFTKGTKKNVHGITYPSEWQDFSTSSEFIFRLDSWVFDKYLEWLSNEGEREKHKNGLIIFLHLLGCDTNGHSHKPHSREYIGNMEYVSEKVQEIVQKTESLFNDGKTAYLFTADHGMTDWGSHGSGSTDETETPLIVWGAGINNLHSRQDVEQADLTPLISSLIGISIPVNNEGVLPVQYLRNGNDTYGIRALLNNIKQLALQIKQNRIVSCTSNINNADLKELTLNKKIRLIEELLTEGKISTANVECKKTVALAKQFLSYFRRYQRNRLIIYLTVMWLAWIVFFFLKTIGVQRRRIKETWKLVIDAGLFIVIILLFLEHRVSGCDNWRLLCYAVFTVFSIWLAIKQATISMPKLLMKIEKKCLLEIIGAIILLIIMFTGLSFRWTIGLGMLFIAFMQKTLFKDSHYLLFWTSLALGIFPLLPVVEPQPRPYIVQFSICVTIFVLSIIQIPRNLKAIEIIRLLITVLVYSGFIDGRSWIAWIILLSVPLTICTYSISVKSRGLAIIFGLFSPLALLSASYEPIFFQTLAIHLFCWLHSATNIHESKEIRLTTEDFLKASIFMLYTLLSFFGTGNMASISSFDPSWTRHFVTVFSPFTMASLILFKMSIPLILVGYFCRVLGTPATLVAVLLLGDCLSLFLMYGVTPEGSWLDIGSAISRFTIAITLPCLLFLLYNLSHLLMKFQWNIFTVVPKRDHVV